jgi:hypothetical protein
MLNIIVMKYGLLNNFKHKFSITFVAELCVLPVEPFIKQAV